MVKNLRQRAERVKERERERAARNSIKGLLVHNWSSILSDLQRSLSNSSITSVYQIFVSISSMSRALHSHFSLTQSHTLSLTGSPAAWGRICDTHTAHGTLHCSQLRAQHPQHQSVDREPAIRKGPSEFRLRPPAHTILTNQIKKNTCPAPGPQKTREKTRPITHRKQQT